MDSDLSYALQITLIGTGLVFTAIVLLWGFMALLVRLTAFRVAEKAGYEQELRHKAAAAAVSAALSEQADQTKVHAFPLPPTSLVSAWQAVRRSNHLRQRGPR